MEVKTKQALESAKKFFEDACTIFNTTVYHLHFMTLNQYTESHYDNRLDSLVRHDKTWVVGISFTYDWHSEKYQFRKITLTQQGEFAPLTVSKVEVWDGNPTQN